MIIRLRNVLATVLALPLLGAVSTAGAAPLDFDAELLQIQQAWAHANYELTADAREGALEQLVTHAADFAQRNPSRAEPLIWEGIVESSYAGARGGLGALRVAKSAREHLDAAAHLDAHALGGSALTSLGALYYKVPGFPLGFGDHDKARAYLRQALDVDPAGIDANFFYGEFLYEQGDYRASIEHLERALRAPARANREVADRGRRGEIAALLDKARRKVS